MLPGFRFLLAAILLCISILVFGLGAAALLRTAHEEFAQIPSWRASPEPRFAQAEAPAKTVLAMLRVEPTATEIKTQPKTATDAPINTLPRRASISSSFVTSTGAAPGRVTGLVAPANDSRSEERRVGKEC